MMPGRDRGRRRRVRRRGRGSGRRAQNVRTAPDAARSAGLSRFNRVEDAAEIAEAAAVLASPKSSWAAGQIVQPNGSLI